jgi:hypothetical protein
VEFKGLQVVAASTNAALAGWQVHVTMSCAVAAGKLYRAAYAANAFASLALKVAASLFCLKAVITPGVHESSPERIVYPRLAHVVPAAPNEVLKIPPMGDAFFIASADSATRDGPSAQKSSSLEVKLVTSEADKPAIRRVQQATANKFIIYIAFLSVLQIWHLLCGMLQVV